MKRKKLSVIAAIVAAVTLAGCSLYNSGEVLRSDPPINGYNGSLRYRINSTANGAAEVNEITYSGINNTSPMPLLTTTYGRGASSRVQGAQMTSADGTAVNILAMNKRDINVGLTNYLEAQVATYEQRDALGNRVCGAKVRLNFMPDIAQVVMDDRYRRAWDALWYYSVPCKDTAVTAVNQDGTASVKKPSVELDLTHATMMAMVIDQQFTPRVTGRPILFNRGHSVTIVGGKASNFVGGWWQSPAGLLNASNLIIDMVKDLDDNEWLKFGDKAYGSLVYSAGDADVYLSLQRIFLDRQSDYLVNFRSTPSEPWKRVLVHPVYNFEWNDFSQMYHALTGTSMPNIDDMVDQNTGLPKDINSPESYNSQVLKEIETAGCQNCQNPTLEQIQFIDANQGSQDYGQPLYAMTIRGWLGSQSSLVMFGKVPGSVSSYMDDAEKHRQQSGMTSCPIQYDENGQALPQDRQYTAEQCALWLREGALWDLLTQDPNKFGFDVVGQFSVRDNTAWSSKCYGSGDSTHCTLVATNRELDASYLFTDTDAKLQKSWTVMQLLGEVGMRTLGMSYASGVYDGSGLDFAMAQPQVYNSYYTNLSSSDYNPELLFALDARALQLPGVLGQAGKYLGLR